MWQEEKKVHTTSSETTMQLGAWLSSRLQTGDAVAFLGSLGAGKTTFIRGLVHELGFKGRVKSPSYTLVNIYPAKFQVVHADLYRISDKNELLALDFEEALEEGILLVEWAERAGGEWGNPNWKVELEYNGDEDDRLITISKSVNN